MAIFYRIEEDLMDVNGLQDDYKLVYNPHEN
jgi:hypothetical protein